MRIAIYLITKKESELLDRALASAQDADLIVVGDTGNDEATKNVCKKHNAICYDITVTPWRFDDSRNAVLALIPADVDICVPLDSDEVLAPGWREEIEKVWKPGETTIMRYMYDWSNGVTFMQAKIHARSGYRWTRPCHEIVTRYAEGPDVYCTTDKFLMYHHPDNTKARSYYLPLLRMGYKEQPRDDRSVFYYGRELYLQSNYPGLSDQLKGALRRESTKILHEALELIKDHANRAEASYAWRMIGQMNDDEEAFKTAIKELPTHREPYIWYADWLYYEKRFKEAAEMAEAALAITQRTTDYTVEGRSWDGYPHHLLSWCHYHMYMEGMGEMYMMLAIEDQEEAIKIEPDNAYYKICLEKFKSEQAQQTTREVPTDQGPQTEEATVP